MHWYGSARECRNAWLFFVVRRLGNDHDARCFPKYATDGRALAQDTNAAKDCGPAAARRFPCRELALRTLAKQGHNKCRNSWRPGRECTVAVPSDTMANPRPSQCGVGYWL